MSGLGLGRARSLAVCLAACSLTGCVGTTGSDLFEFGAYAAGPNDAVAGEPYTFETGRGFTVTLGRARLHVGAVYLNESVPSSVSSDTTCTLPGIYVAEVTEGLDVDVLSPELQAFPRRGSGTGNPARAGEVWLVGDRDVNAASDPTEILVVAGTAVRGADTYPFEGVVTIGENRLVDPPSPALPGARPICKQRVVSPIQSNLVLDPRGILVLRVDPRGLFGNVDFATLPPPVSGEPYRFADDSRDQASANLFGGLRAASGTYSFDWQETP